MNASTCTLCGVDLHRLTRSGRCRRHSSTASQQNVARLQVLAWAAKVPRLRERDRKSVV